MLTYDQALKAILENCQTLSSESVHLTKALRRVIAAPVKATFDLPQFNNSAVDGFGVLVEDLIGASEKAPIKLKVIGEVAAGGSWQHGQLQLNPGQCIRILTGAAVPGTVEAVVMKEVCQLLDGQDEIMVTASTRIGENIRLQGEEIEAGATVLQPGMLVTPPVVGMIASLGITELSVYRSPRVAVIATGDELVEPGQALADGQIYNSNSFALVAALNAIGVAEVQRFHTRDNREETTKILSEAIEFGDIIISAGGVSVGEYDIVKDVFEELGVETVFWRIAIKPGKPVYFGKRKSDGRTNNSSKNDSSKSDGSTNDSSKSDGSTNDSSKSDANTNNSPSQSSPAPKLVFGLPGNPVSALVTFNLFVKPAIALLQGQSTNKRLFQAKAARNLKKKAGRLDFVRGNLSALKAGQANNLVAMPTGGQESHMLSGLAKADCLMHFGQDLEFLPEGDHLTVELLNWFE